ncbi:MAG: hypothetical protein U0992_19825 [Planctomycetaceae bacterium]
MAYATRAIPGTPYHYVRMSGDWGLSDAVAMFRELAANNPSLADHRLLCDVRDGRVNLSLADTMALVDVFRSHAAAFTGMRFVVLVPDVFQYGLACSCGLMAGSVQFDFYVTLSPEIACTWAGIPIDALEEWHASSLAAA